MWVFKDIEKHSEMPKPLLKIDLFVCLVEQGAGVPGGLRPPNPPRPTYMHRSLCAGTTRRTKLKHKKNIGKQQKLYENRSLCVCVAVEGPGAYRGVPPRTPTFVSSGAL